MAEFTKEESKKLIEAFQKLELKPKFDSPEELATWLEELASHAATAGNVKHESGGATADTATIAPVITPVITPVNAQYPRISVFSGDCSKPSDTTYDLWKYEVKCLMADKIYSSAAVASAVRRSLKGKAGNVVMRLGPHADVIDILVKLDSIYGAIDQKEDLLAKFYSAKQGEDEDVSNWGCRLEDILSKAMEQGIVPSADFNNMLKNKFWTGLKKSLKDVSGHKFDTVSDFDTLRVIIRRIEQDQTEQTSKKPHPAKLASTPKQDTDMGEIKGMIKQLSAEVSKLKQNQESMGRERQKVVYDGSRQYGRGRDQDVGYDGSHEYGRGRPQQSGYDGSHEYGRGGPQQPRYDGSRQGQGTFDRRSDSNRPHQYEQPQFAAHGASYAPQQSNEGREEPICWRCGQLGHFRSRCRVIIDHLRRPLNARGPMGRGHP
jgi:hypothetical protein